MPTLYLIDGSGYIFRAYHALPPLSSPSGTPVGAVYGFLNMLLKLRETTGDDAIAVVFDAGRHTFRNRMYDGYKANRPEAPADLIPQFALVREAADALGIARVERDDVEADDVIASYARKAREAGMEVVIVSSDKDLMQLVGEGIRMHDPIKNKPIGEAEVMEKFGVPPAKVREVLSLIGDSSDNVPGVPGIGPKTAAELIGQYGDLETLLAHAAEIRQEKRRAMLMEHADKARLSHALVGLKEDVELPLPLEALAARAPEAEKLGDFLQAQGFKSLFARLKPRFEFAEREGAPPVAASSPPAVAYEAVQEMNSLERWVRQAQAQGMVGVDLQATSGDAMRAEMIGVALSLSPGIACYIPLGHRKPGSESMSLPRDDLFAAPAGLAPDCGFSQLPRDAALAALKPLFEDASVLKVGSDIKYDALLLKRHGIGLAPVDDSMLLSYLLGAGLHGHAMEELSERYLGHKPMAYEEVTGTGKARIGFAEAGLEKACAYAAE
ncbi:MAG: DNA polymerase I, partial [Alphaproteobacteria bacterium]|nr:DNA polymerase I [Alphaproteobacteria bacterium]